MKILKVSAEVWRGWPKHAHGAVGMLLLDLDRLGDLTVLSLQLVLQLSERHPQHRLEVADKAIHVPLPGHLVDDVLVVVIAETSAQLLVVHLGLVLA